LRRESKPKPRSPEPSNNKEPGSGTTLFGGIGVAENVPVNGVMMLVPPASSDSNSATVVPLKVAANVPVMSSRLWVVVLNVKPSMLKLATAPFAVSVSENGPVVEPGSNSVKNTSRFEPPALNLRNAGSVAGFGVKVLPGVVIKAFKLWINPASPAVTPAAAKIPLAGWETIMSP